MTLEEFQLSISSNFMDTYIFARELQIAEEVERAIKKQKRDNDKVIDTEENLQDTFNLAQIPKTNGTSFVGNEYDESVA
jgi:c-di-GMP-related signal transduction protein